MFRLVLLIAVFLLAQMTVLNGQVTDSLEVDSVATEVTPPPPPPKIKALYPVPKRALILPLVPVLGQVYNKKIWKVPIVLGGIGFASYMIIKNKKEYNRLDAAYRARYDDDPTTIDTEFALFSNDAVYGARAVMDKNVQVAWIWTGVVYSLSMIDAFVDAHLAHFDVSDDLSFELVPSSIDGMGIGLCGRFRF